MLAAKESRQHLIYKNISLRNSLLSIKGELWIHVWGISPIISLLNNAAFALVAVLYSR